MGEKGITISDQGKTVKVDVFEDADLLSDEEKAAMKEDDELEPGVDVTVGAEAGNEASSSSAEQAAINKQVDQEAKNEEEKAAEIAKADAQIEAKKAVDDKAADDTAAAEAAKKAGTDEAGGDETTIVVPQTPPPVMMEAMSTEQVDAVKKGLEEAQKSFQDGEISYDKYFEQRLSLERQLWANDIALQLSSDGIEQQWQWEQSTFLADDQNAWINEDDVVYAAFSATVNRIMATDEGAVMAGPSLLAQAREQVAARFSPDQPAETEAAAEAKRKAEALKNLKDKEANKEIPLTLRDIPLAEEEQGGVGEFDYLDKLDGAAYEKAVEGLSEAQLSRYSNS